MADYGHDILKGDPGHPLFAGPDGAAGSQAKRQRHARKSAAVFCQNDAEAQRRNAGAEFRGTHGFGFPVARQRGQEIGAGRAGFGEHFVAAIAIEADGRGGDEDAGRAAKPGQCIDQMMRGGYAAVAQQSFALCRPAAVGNRSARQMDNAVGGLGGRVEWLVSAGIPRDIAFDGKCRCLYGASRAESAAEHRALAFARPLSGRCRPNLWNR